MRLRGISYHQSRRKGAREPSELCSFNREMSLPVSVSTPALKNYQQHSSCLLRNIIGIARCRSFSHVCATRGGYISSGERAWTGARHSKWYKFKKMQCAFRSIPSRARYLLAAPMPDGGDSGGDSLYFMSDGPPLAWVSRCGAAMYHRKPNFHFFSVDQFSPTEMPYS